MKGNRYKYLIDNKEVTENDFKEKLQTYFIKEIDSFLCNYDEEEMLKKFESFKRKARESKSYSIGYVRENMPSRMFRVIYDRSIDK